MTKDKTELQEEENQPTKPPVILAVEAQLYQDGTHDLAIKYGASEVDGKPVFIWGLVKAIEVELMERTSPHHGQMLEHVTLKLDRLYKQLVTDKLTESDKQNKEEESTE